MVDIVSRSQWGARAPRSRQTVSWSQRSEVTLHYTLGPTSQSVRSIQDHHMDVNGWADIGYNLLVDENGTAYEGRGWTAAGAHARGANTSGIGIAYIGRDGMTSAAKETVVALYDEANGRTGRTLARRGHRDINATTCPGDGNYTWWRSANYRDAAASTWEDPLIGLGQGDQGEGVTAVQRLITYAGGELPVYGVDGHWGAETSAALLAVRQSVGSSVQTATTMTGTAHAQLIRAVARAEAQAAC